MCVCVRDMSNLCDVGVHWERNDNEYIAEGMGPEP